MPVVMTMDANNVPTVPLDLRTTTRHRRGVEDRTQNIKDCNANSRVSTEASLEAQTSRLTASVNNRDCRATISASPEYPNGSQVVIPLTNMGKPTFLEHFEHAPMSQGPSPKSPSSPKYTVSSGETGAAHRRNIEKSPSNLPFRKRPFPARDVPGQSHSSSSRGDHLSREKETELNNLHIRRVLKGEDQESKGCALSMPPRHLAGGFEETENKSNDLRAVNSYYGYSVYVFPPQAQQLLEDVALATHPDEDGDTALHIAVVKGEEGLVYRLIHLLTLAHKDLDTYNNLRQTPLHLAVITHQAKLVEALLRAGADHAALDRCGQTSLHLCCEHSQQACLSVLLSQALPSRSPSLCLEIRNFEGLTPLHLAVQGGHVELARLLLDAGASINAMDNKSGQSPLMHAVENHNADMVHFLIENACDVNSQSYSGNTALHVACGRGQVDTVRLLMKNGADSSLKNYHNDTPVMVAKNKRVTDVLRGKGSKLPKTQEQQSASALPPRSLPHRLTGSLSPNYGTRGARSTTPLPSHRGAAQHPRVPSISFAHSQSIDSSSGPLSPMEIPEIEPQPVRMGFNNMAVADLPQGRAYPVPLYLSSLNHSPLGDCTVRALMPDHPVYYQPVAQGNYYPESSFILLPTQAGFCPTSQTSTGESRPLSCCSDQSLASTLSVSSGGKGDS
ncbi:NF-kappa-B inhibitor epsilon [Osmerus mordax]|uniref:NF-kappa-B inhibitor epsilon n=1 Tax=Osmerus mordax TaxID=8014 RepID=UPI00350EF40D